MNILLAFFLDQQSQPKSPAATPWMWKRVCVCILVAQGLIDGQYLQTKHLPVSQTG